MPNVQIYTDGACSGNPGPGGWAAILMAGDRKKEISGGEAETTNNRMELMGVISALEALKKPCQVAIFSDSKYIVDAINLGWVQNWQKKGWMRNRKEQAKNVDLWTRLLSLMTQHEVEFHWVKGHADNPYNNRCDQLAVLERDRFLQVEESE